MTTEDDAKTLDPRNLIFEAYRIEGITSWDCRSIFLDWVLGFPVDTDQKPRISALLDRYGADNPDHPMTEVLRAGLAAPAVPKRRGGRAGRKDT